MSSVRTTVTMPLSLIRDVDRLAGRRGRSRYIAEAVIARLKRDRRERLRLAIEASFGALVSPGDRPMSRAEVSASIRELREEQTD